MWYCLHCWRQISKFATIAQCGLSGRRRHFHPGRAPLPLHTEPPLRAVHGGVRLLPAVAGRPGEPLVGPVAWLRFPLPLCLGPLWGLTPPKAAEKRGEASGVWGSVSEHRGNGQSAGISAPCACGGHQWPHTGVPQERLTLPCVGLKLGEGVIRLEVFQTPHCHRRAWAFAAKLRAVRGWDLPLE